MKALILNSGVGSRLKSIETCKCMAKLAGSVSIFDAQISALLQCGTDDIYITTGPYNDMLVKYAKESYPKAKFTFIHNPLYNVTNYIYSIHLTRKYLEGSDILLLHGDLVFEQSVLQDILAAEHSVMAVDSTKALPEKDFKAQIINGKIASVSVDEEYNAVYAQPMYKLKKRDWDIWGRQIDNYCRLGITGVYAENAFNEVSGDMELLPLDITGRVCFEVDNDEDLADAADAYAKMTDRQQIIYAGHGSRKRVNEVLEKARNVTYRARDAVIKSRIDKPFVVCGIDIDTAQELIGPGAVYFKDFKQFPGTDDIRNAGMIFEKEDCDFIISLGGGSAIDTAKGIKRENPQIGHLSIPTNAGTGSESTCFAAIYEDGIKQSMESMTLLPEFVILDPIYLKTLPEYHKKSTLLDALCQATESLWAKGRTQQSVAYARAARQIICNDAAGYLSGDTQCDERMLYAANYAGRAINIGKTTAAHAMSYTLSTLLGISHGHAVALCIIPVWEHLIKSGKAPEELQINQLQSFINLFNSMNLSINYDAYSGDMNTLTDVLVKSINTQRMRNHPAALTENDITDMYNRILPKQGKQ